MLHVFYGADEFRASEALGALKASLDSDGSLASNTTVLTGRGLTPAELLQHAAALPFLGPVRLVVVEGLLTALGSRRGVADTWQPLIDFVPQMPESNHVVLIEPPPRSDARRNEGVGRSPLLSALKGQPNVTVTEFAALKSWARGGPSEVAQWLQDRAVRAGISIEPAAIEELAEQVGPNLRMLASEIEKLATYAQGRAITADDVRLLTPQTNEESIFALVDAVVEGQTAIALRQLHRMLSEGQDSSDQVRRMIARQVRLILRATELLEQHASQEDVAQATGQRGFPLTKLMRQARATTRGSAEAALRALEASDHAIKTGRLRNVRTNDERELLQLELLVTQLAALAPRHARRGAPTRQTGARQPARAGR